MGKLLMLFMGPHSPFPGLNALDFTVLKMGAILITEWSSVLLFDELMICSIL